MNTLIDAMSHGKTTDELRLALWRCIKFPNMYAYMKDWPVGCFPQEEDLQEFFKRPYLRMVRVCSSKLVGDTAELAGKQSRERFKEFCMMAPGRLAEQLNQMFRPEDREHVRVMRMETYPATEGFNFSILFTAVVYYNGDRANWNRPLTPIKDTDAYAFGCVPPEIGL